MTKKFKLVGGGVAVAVVGVVDVVAGVAVAVAVAFAAAVAACSGAFRVPPKAPCVVCGNLGQVRRRI